MNDLTRAFRRLSGQYVPYLEPYWDEACAATVAVWLKTGAIEDVRDNLTGLLRSQFPASSEIVLTDTGKTALFVALKMLGLGAGDEVVVPSYCCASVIAAVLHARCVPVLADCDAHFNICEQSVASAISPRTKVILVAHLFGLMAADLDGILALARQRGIAVIEDVAQAYGLRLADGLRAGSHGDAAIFSAGIGKPIMGPGGGWAVMNRAVAAAPVLDTEPRGEAHARVAEFVARFTGRRWRRGFGEIAHALPARFATRMRRRPDFDRQAWADGECRGRTMGDIDAWLAYRQIQRIDENIERRRANAARWGDLLQGARLPCRLPPADANVFTVLPLLFEGADAARTAGFARQSLERGGVATEPCYTPLHVRTEASDFRRTNMDMCESLWRRVFAVPVRPNLPAKDWARIEAAMQGAVRAP